MNCKYWLMYEQMNIEMYGLTFYGIFISIAIKSKMFYILQSAEKYDYLLYEGNKCVHDSYEG